jgi:hypothetical protein
MSANVSVRPNINISIATNPKSLGSKNLDKIENLKICTTDVDIVDIVVHAVPLAIFFILLFIKIAPSNYVLP